MAPPEWRSSGGSRCRSCWRRRPAGQCRFRFARLIRAPDDTLYLVDCNFVKLRELRPRHPVVRQGAAATELGYRYLAGLVLGGRLSPYLLRFRSRFYRSTFAVLIGTTGGIAKIRGCRRGWCSADEASFGADVGASAPVVCCFGLNRSSASWRALLTPSRSWRALAGCRSVGKRCLRKNR